MTNTTLDGLLKWTGRRVLPYVPIPLKRHAIYFRLYKKFMPRNPSTFLDKVNWRILHDRREILAWGGDKLAMKHHAAHSSPQVLIPRTIWHGPTIEPIIDKDWGPDWVFKPREGSGYTAFGSGSLADSGITAELVKSWRHLEHYRVHGVWGYGQSPSGYLIEERIPTEDGSPPNDLRFYVFHGKVRLIQVDTPRFTGVQRRFYSPDWAPYDVKQGRATLGPIRPRPERLDKLIDIAQEIGSIYDFLRVDLYDVPQGVYFGEITPYPTGGTARFSDPKFDQMLGSWWTLPPLSEVRATKHS
jgi:hypothetical protein